MNFALYRHEVFHDIMWDRKLKLREHQDFFYRLSKTRHKVMFTPDATIIDNKNKQSPEYKALKGRDEFWAVMMKKHGIHKFKYLNGSVVELEENDLISRSWETPCNF